MKFKKSLFAIVAAGMMFGNMQTFSSVLGPIGIVAAMHAKWKYVHEKQLFFNQLIKDGDVNKVKAFLDYCWLEKKYLDPNGHRQPLSIYKDFSYEAPLHCAARNNRIDVAKFLISKGVDPIVIDCCYPSYERASEESSTEEMRKLLVEYEERWAVALAGSGSRLFGYVFRMAVHHEQQGIIIFILETWVKAGIDPTTFRLEEWDFDHWFYDYLIIKAKEKHREDPPSAPASS